MKLNTAFKLSALAAALSVSATSFAGTNINTSGSVSPTFGTNINLNGNTTVAGNLSVNGTDVLVAISNEVTARAAADTQLQTNINSEATARVAADTQLQTNINSEATARAAADTAITDSIAAGVTTASLTVNGPSQLNGEVTVNNVKSTQTIDVVGTPATTPTFGADANSDGRPDTLIQTKEQTDAVTVNTQSQVYNENNLTFSSKVEKGTTTTTDQYVAEITYDDNGVATYGSNTALGQTVADDLQVVAEDLIIVGKESADSQTALTVRSKDATGEFETVVTSKDVTTGNVLTETITLGGEDLATTLADESARVDAAIAAGDEATLTAANDYTDATAATLRSEAATESARLDQAIVDGDEATLASANANTASTAATLRDEATAEFARVNAAIVSGSAETLSSAKTYADVGDTATLASANAYTNTQVANVNSRVSQLNSRIDDVEKTSYRGIAIALAAQQQIPNIGAGQFAVFGGVGHYEGESAAALGVASVFADGRTSVSAALGFAGGSEVGGRVGVSYVFGGE